MSSAQEHPAPERAVADGAAATADVASGAATRTDAAPDGAELERRILALLASRASTSSICPSDVARDVTSDETKWRPLMEPVRQAARRLMDAGEVEITQHGSVIDPTAIKGPIRIRWPRP